MTVADEPMRRLLDYDGRRYWLENGWSIRFRIIEVETTKGRPHGVKYSFTLHDVSGVRLLGFDNAHGVGRGQAHDHQHSFGDVAGMRFYDFKGADELICDFFGAVERACAREGVAFAFVIEDVEAERADDADEPDDAA